MPDFKFNLGDEVKDEITGFKGIVTCRSQWITNCNTYGVQSRKLKDGKPMDREHFDEPKLKLIKAAVKAPAPVPAPIRTGGPERPVHPTNRMKGGIR